MAEMKEKYEEFKEQVRAQADITKIVSDYVPLKKKGGRYWGCCPFHGEKTPSFTVDESKGLYHCFGCGVGGDVFNFVMKIENKTFPEALKFLANKLNIPVPERERTPEQIAREMTAKEVYEANDLAVKFFHSCLINTQYGHKALEYLTNRGISKEIIEEFSLGLAPPDYNKLHEALEKRGVKEDTLLKAGLCGKSTKGFGIYDRFRERVMIPIKDARGKTVGFGGRIIAQGEPKYLNTGETDWFRKRRILFGLDSSLKAIKEHKQVVVVEGYMDAISLHAAGITWAVASLGTAFSKEHGEIIKKIAPEVIFSFDSDKAGLEAAMRAVGIANEIDLPSRVLVVNDGKDPDEYVRKHGKEGFVNLIAKAPKGMQFQIDKIIKENNVSTFEGKISAVSNIIPFLSECKNDIEVAHYIKALAVRLTIDESLIQGEYTKYNRANKKERAVVTAVAVDKTDTLTGHELAERHLLAALIESKMSFWDEVVGELQEINFTVPSHKEIFELLEKIKAENKEVKLSTMFEYLSADGASELTRISEVAMAKEALKQAVLDCITEIKINALKTEFSKHSELAEKYQKEGNNQFLQELSECQRINKDINNLLKNKGKEGVQW